MEERRKRGRPKGPPKPPKPPPPEREFKQVQVGSRSPRNFYVDGFAGITRPDGTLQKLRRFGGGGREKVAGIDLEIFQRSGPDKLGAVRVAWMEARATPEGKLTLKIFAPDRGGRVKVVVDTTSWRLGVPLEDSKPVLEEVQHGKAETEAADGGDVDARAGVAGNVDAG
jgi:hypothetical protein